MYKFWIARRRLWLVDWCCQSQSALRSWIVVDSVTERIATESTNRSASSAISSRQRRVSRVNYKPRVSQIRSVRSSCQGIVEEPPGTNIFRDRKSQAKRRAIVRLWQFGVRITTIYFLESTSPHADYRREHRKQVSYISRGGISLYRRKWASRNRERETEREYRMKLVSMKLRESQSSRDRYNHDTDRDVAVEIPFGIFCLWIIIVGSAEKTSSAFINRGIAK